MQLKNTRCGKIIPRADLPRKEPARRGAGRAKERRDRPGERGKRHADREDSAFLDQLGTSATAQYDVGAHRQIILKAVSLEKLPAPRLSARGARQFPNE